MPTKAINNKKPTMTVKTTLPIKNSTKLQANYLPSEKFMKYYLEKSLLFPAKLDKKTIQKELVNRHRFKTQICHDTSYTVIIEAEKSIDRKMGIAELQKYLGELYLAIEMEKGLFEFALGHITVNKQPSNFISHVYTHHLITLCRNLDVNDTGVENKTLLPMIREDGFDPFFVPFLQPRQMHPERWLAIANKKKIEEDTVNNFLTTDIYTCKKCKDKRFRITEIQIRSLDESSSKVNQCMTCGYTFII